MKIVTLIENTTQNSQLRAEHGLSLYIETLNHRILFDAGQSPAFAENAYHLGVDLASVDIAILSHGHYDHGNGFIRFLELNKKAVVYLNSHAFEPHFNGRNQDIGLNPQMRDSSRLRFVDGDMFLDSGIRLCSGKDLMLRYPVKSSGLCTLRHGVQLPDDFCHEQYLLIQEAGKRYCITGCAHRGILNILDWFQPDVLIGGFHLKDLPPDSESLCNTAQIMQRYPTTYYTGHCTGLEQYDIMKQFLKDQLYYLSTGTQIVY